MDIPHREQTRPHDSIAPTSPALFDCYLVTCLMAALATHYFPGFEVAKQRPPQNQIMTRRWGPSRFPGLRAPQFCRLLHLSTRQAGAGATMGTEMRRQMVTT
jgi:hypothetical protein